MIQIPDFIDSTFLKTPEQSGLTEEQTQQKIVALMDEAIVHGFYAIMIRPDYIKMAKDYLTQKSASTKVGTVISFHEGKKSIQAKLQEARKSIADGADELDFVLNYTEYLKGNLDLVKEEVISCTKLCYEHHKVAKWIIEIAALNEAQIQDISTKIKEWVTSNFPSSYWESVFIKSSTGFYITQDGKPNGATFEAIKILLSNGSPLPIKAAGGVKSTEDALKMISMGVKRIGTSSAASLISHKTSATESY